MSRRIPIACLLLLISAVVLAAAQPSHKLTLDLYLEMQEVSEPQISPDGKQIVYTRTWIDKVNDRRKTSLWIMNSDGTRDRFLVEGSSPRWSPDGTRLAYLAEGQPKGTQIFVRWMDAEGAVSQITHLDKSPSTLSWSPDGNSIAFYMMVPSEKTGWNIKMPRRPEGAKWVEEPRIIERLVYRRDRIGFLEDGYRHIFVVSASGGAPVQLTSGDYDDAGAYEYQFGFKPTLAWTADNREVLFSALRTDGWEYQWRESEIYAVGAREKTIRQLTHRKGPDGNPTVSPDGRWVAYVGFDWTNDTYIAPKLYVMGIDGSRPRLLNANFDRNPENLFWAPDNSGIYFTTEDRGTHNFYFAPIEGQVRPVTQGNHVLNVTDLSRGGQAVGTLTTYQKPHDVVTFSVSQPQPKPLTAIHDGVLRDVKLGEVEEIWYNSVDNFRIQGWILKPPDFDLQKKYPLILVIHGGPHGMYDVGFNFGWQNHAAEGYVVLYTNPRGSTGYGSSFGNAIKNAYPGKDFDDLMKGVDEVVGRGYVDTRNLFVYGCSGGGLLTAWVVGHTNRFAAASSDCPVIDWLSFVGTTDGAYWYRNFQKMPWEDPGEHLKRSPIMYVGNVKTPTLLMTGVNDSRTPIPQTEEFYQALKARQVPVAMIRFNNEWHGTTSTPSNYLRTQLYLHHWFAKYMTKTEAGSPSTR